MNRMRALSVAVLCVGLGGCLGAFEPDVGALRAGVCKPEDSDPATDVSFENDVLPMFQRKAPEIGCGCHQPDSMRPIGIDISGLDLSSYSAVMHGGDLSADTIVVPGDPCSSVLVQKLSSAPPFGSRMPSSGPPYMSPADRKLIADWIAEGARDN